MVGEFFVVGGGVDLGVDAALKIGHFLGPFVDEEDNAVALGVVFDHAVGDIVEEGGLARAGRGHDEPAGAFPYGAEEVHDAGGHTAVLCFEADLLVRGDGDHLLESIAAFAFFEEGPVHLFNETDFRVWEALVLLGFTFDETALFELEALDQLARDERVVGLGFPVAGRVDQLSGLVLEDFKDAGNGNFVVAGWLLV